MGIYIDKRCLGCGERVEEELEDGLCPACMQLLQAYQHDDLALIQGLVEEELE